MLAHKLVLVLEVLFLVLNWPAAVLLKPSHFYLRLGQEKLIP